MDWFRYHTSALDNRKIQTMPRRLTLDWLNFLSLQRVNICERGVSCLPEIEVIAFRLRYTIEKATSVRDELVKLRFIDPLPDGAFTMHDWDAWQRRSDDSTVRKRRQRVGHVTGHVTGHSRDSHAGCPNAEKKRIDIEGEESREDWRARFESWLEAIQSRHPKRSGNGESGRMLMEYLDQAVHPEREMESIDARHQEYCAFWERRREAEGIDAPQLDTWVSKNGWLDAPPPLRRKRSGPATIADAFGDPQ